MIFIKEDLKVNDTQISVLAGILNVCALVGSLAAGRTSDFLGRRYTIVLASIMFLVGSVLMGYAPNYPILLTGRCTAGVGVGYALMIAPVYSAEISSPKSRGFITSLPELCISTGILTGYLANYFMAALPLKLGWRLMLGIAAVPSLGLAIGILKMPESPRWLVMRGRLGEAKRILLKVSNSKEEAQIRFRDIKLAAGIDEDCNEDSIKPPTSTGGGGMWKELLLRPTPSVRWMLLATIGIHFFEHATGIEAVMLFCPRILKKAGVTSKDKLLLGTIGVGLTKLTFMASSTLLIDRVGRRPLLLTSTAGMIAALTGLGIGLTNVENAKEKSLWVLGLCFVLTYTFVAFFNIGVAPVTWVYPAEIFPLKLRAQGASIGVAVNRGTNAAISISFIPIYKAITIGGSFFMFSGISVVAWLFFYFLLPETKGKPLEEMEELFTRGSRSNKSKNVGVEILLKGSNA